MAREKYIPTFEEVWSTGYFTHTGSFKKAIFQNKNSASDLEKLNAVKNALEANEIQLNVDSLDKFNKTRAMELYKELLLVRRDAELRHMVETQPTNYKLVVTVMDMVNFLNLIKDETLIAIDTETTGLDYIDKHDIIGVSVSLDKADMHYYIPFGHNPNEIQLPKEYVVKCLRPILESSRYRAVYHNAKFDLHMFKKLGIDATKSFHFCTQVGFKLLNENEPSYVLKVLATKYGKHFGFDGKSSTFEELFGKDCLFSTVPLKYASVYAIKDTHLTLCLYKWIMSFFKKMPQLQRYWDNIEHDTLLVSMEMEQNGFLIDKEFAHEYAEELLVEIQQLELELKEHFGDINLNSPKQLSEFLYDIKKLPDVTNKRSTDKKALKALASKFKGCEVLLKYRDLNKLYSTYILPLPEKVAQRDQRLHGQFRQDGTVTGRFASSKPNLQNLPYRARHIVVAQEGKIIIGIDYSWLM